MADFDVPAFLDKIVEVTKQDKIHLIGQSMGTTILFAFLSENHTYDKMVSTGHVFPKAIFGMKSRTIFSKFRTLTRDTMDITRITGAFSER